MNIVNLNDKYKVKVPGTFDELSPLQLEKIARILSLDNNEKSATCLALLLVILPKTSYVQWMLFRCFLIRIPFLKRLAYGGLLLQHLQKMFVLTDFILKPLPPDWGDSLTWDDYCTLCNEAKSEKTVSIKFFSTLVKYCPLEFQSLPWQNNDIIKQNLMNDYSTLMFSLQSSSAFAKLFKKSKSGSNGKFGMHSITIALSATPSEIGETEKAKALNVLAFLVTKMESAEKNKKK